MIKIIKACLNDACEANGKKARVKESDVYCSKCGCKLYHVCNNKKCYTVLQSDEAEYCMRCLAAREDKKAQRKKTAGELAGKAIQIAAFVAPFAGGAANGGKVAKAAKSGVNVAKNVLLKK